MASGVRTTETMTKLFRLYHRPAHWVNGMSMAPGFDRPRQFGRVGLHLYNGVEVQVEVPVGFFVRERVQQAAQQ